ncbi:MAG: ATP-binding cassette domain-containing protein [Phenylobacterium sp.]|uniref:ATP-binding cassette domain-containing protein n=1 Tax=Phenylobacterium sp. TaxID=1871053 RepID=UPI0027359661|nr:ATP-binding cassette domain-containing protein [Phenylobacterium sp.]MDP3749282.1 ATP-binding cassette domain-containing protein [Phenylobacterium sp.]
MSRPSNHLGSRIVDQLGEIRRVLWQAGDRATAAWLGGALCLVIAGGLAVGFAPLALKHMVDLLAEGGPPAGSGQVLTLVTLYVGALFVQRLCEQAQTYAYGHGEQRLTRRLGSQAFAHMLALPLRFHLDGKSGALAQTLSEGVLGARLILMHVVLTVAPVLVQLGVAGAVMGALFGIQTGVVLLVALGAYAGVFAWGVLRLDSPARGFSASQIEVGGATADSLMNVEAIKAFTAERRFVARYDQILGQREGQWRLFLWRRLENGVAVSAVFALTVGAALLIGGRDVAAGQLTLGDFVLLNAYLLQILRPLEMLGFAVRDMGQGLAYLDNLLAILRRAPEGEPDEPDPLPAPPPDGPAELVFEDVSYAFGPDRQTLRAVSFRAPPRALIGIVGPSGAGKSSLLRLILRFYEPTQGRILLDGRPISEFPLASLRRQIALVSQDTILFNDTIAQNIAVAMEGADEAAIARAAAVARLSDLLANLPEGLQTQVGERGLKLSGGEKQRVSIARAALKGARLVIFDEATAALDTATERAVWEAMSGLAQEATTLVVTHRLSTVAGADEILVLDQGVIVERGRHEDLLAEGGLYARLWRAQDREAADIAAKVDLAPSP